MTPDDAAFLVNLGLLMGVLSLAAVGVVAILRRVGVDLSAWDDPPVTPCPCVDRRPCPAHPWRFDHLGNKPW
jgi:hypothetical protein